MGNATLLVPRGQSVCPLSFLVQLDYAWNLSMVSAFRNRLSLVHGRFLDAVLK